MKIGLLTYHCVPNYGAQLQTLSTVGFLLKNGHSPIVLNWYPQDLEDMYKNRIPEKQVECHKHFSEHFFPISALCRKEKELVEEIDKLDLDAIIAGSDALFKYVPEKMRRRFIRRKLRYVVNNTISCEMIEGNPFFGFFIGLLKKHVPASVYAVSAQNCPYKLMNKKERKEMRLALSNYKLISVRDEWTRNMIKKITGIPDVNIYPDPVLAFNQNCYLNIPSKEEILNKYHLQNNYVVLSFSDWYCEAPYIYSLAVEAAKNGLQPVALPMPEKLFSAGIATKVDLPLSPLDWYALIIHSQGYIGERMHPIVVCLHNAIPFFSFDEYGVKEKKRLFLKKMQYNPFSSKTYHIVREAGLLDNLFSYKTNQPLPDVKMVLDKILRFDKNRCQVFAKEKENVYESGMAEVIQSITKTLPT